MYTALQQYQWAWLYFFSFIFMGTFVIINLLIAVVINNLEQVKAERLEALRQPVSRDELLKELPDTQQALKQRSKNALECRNVLISGDRAG